MRRLLTVMFLSLVASVLADETGSLKPQQGEKSTIRFDLQRPIDPRLIRIEKDGIEGSKLFLGKIHVVKSGAEVRALSGKLNPGDQLVLSGADWKDVRFSFLGVGSEDSPILIRADVPGKVVFSGESSVVFHGSHLVIMGLQFVGEDITKKDTVIFRLGNGKKSPAENCIVNRIVIKDCGSASTADQAKIRMWYMTVRGADNTVANSTFSGLKNYGQMLAAQELPAKKLLRLHVLNNRFVDRPFLNETNGFEILQIGWSGEVAKSAGSLIEGNVFENCDGEDEIITLKASDIIVRNNTFNACQGCLCVRTARRVLLEGNVFDGKNRPRTAGIRLQGSGHVVIENKFLNLRKPENYFQWPLSLMAASAENYGDNGDVTGYGRAKDILIARNLFDGNDARIAVGIYPRPEYPLLPKNIWVRDNLFKGDYADGSPFDYIAPDKTGELRKTIHESGNRFVQQKP